jgi:hypothetical protein
MSKSRAAFWMTAIGIYFALIAVGLFWRDSDWLLFAILLFAASVFLISGHRIREAVRKSKSEAAVGGEPGAT